MNQPNPSTTRFQNLDVRYPEGKKLNIAPPPPSTPNLDNAVPNTTANQITPSNTPALLSLPTNKFQARRALLPTPLMSIPLPLLSKPRNTTYPNHPTPLHYPAPAHQLWWCPGPDCGRANQPDRRYCGYCGVARTTDWRKTSRGR